VTIRSDEELQSAVEQANELIQEIQNYVGRERSNAARIRFPRGYIRTAESQRRRLNFLEDYHVRSNIAFTMMLADVQHWLLVRTDIGGSAREMIIKLQFFLLASVVETVTRIYLHGRCGDGYKRRTNYLVEHGVLDQELKDDLDWLWDMRNRWHLFQLDHTEWSSRDYTVRNHNRAVRAFQSLIDCLNARR